MPLIFILFVFSAFSALKKVFKSKDKDSILIVCFSIFPILFFSFLSAFDRFFIYCASFGYFLLCAVLVKDFLPYFEKKLWFKFYVFICAALCIVFIVFAAGFISAPQKLSALYGFERDAFSPKALSSQIDKVLDKQPLKNKPFVFTDDPSIADLLSFYAPNLRVFCISGGIDDYVFLQGDLKRLKGKNALFISK
jgi:hypothetical protein